MKVKELIDETVKRAIEELKSENMIATGKKTPYQKTELLLYNYNNFKNSIKLNDEKIRELKEEGVRKKSGSVINYSGDSCFLTDDFTRCEEQIKAIEMRSKKIQKCIDMIDNALNQIKDDKYYDVIVLKYLYNKSHEKIAEMLDVGVATVFRNKSRLINQMQISLFVDDFIDLILL